MRASIEIRNEFGNDIRVEVETGVPIADHYGVGIRVIGPTSTSENVLTVKEAVALRSCLVGVTL